MHRFKRAPWVLALAGATAAAALRMPAVLTLAVTASGVAAFGVAGAFWGLLAGLALHALDRAAARP